MSKNPPYAPNQLILSATSSIQINLTWADNSADESGFKIERALSNAGPFSPGTGPGLFSLITTVAANVTTYADASLSAGSFYYYRISAVNSAGNSAATSVVSLQTPAAAVATPAAPSGLAATAIAASLINLSWVDNSNSETAFNLERSADNGVTFILIAAIAANATTYQDINLLEMKNYIYRIKAINNAGSSSVSVNASATTLAAGNTATFTYIYTNIIAPNCVKCHGPAMTAGGVNISSYTLVRNQVAAGNAIGSKLYSEINSGSMPPGVPLSALQITAIRNWINAGALNN